MTLGMKVYVESKDQIVEGTIDSRGRFTIPSRTRKKLGINEDDEVQIAILEVEE